MAIQKTRSTVVGGRWAAGVAAVCVALSLAACGGGGGDNPAAPPAPVQPPPTGSATVGGAAQTESVTVRSVQGVEVVVPPGAAAEPVTVRIAADSSSAPPLPDGLRPQGTMFAITPHGAQFAQPVTVRIPAPTATPATNERLMLAKADPNGQWRLIDTGPAVDGYLVAQVQSFSYFMPVFVIYPVTPLQPLRVTDTRLDCATPDCRNLPPTLTTLRVTVFVSGTVLPAQCDGRVVQIAVILSNGLFPESDQILPASNRVEWPVEITRVLQDRVWRVSQEIRCSTAAQELRVTTGPIREISFLHQSPPANPQPRVMSVTLPDVVAGQSAEVSAIVYGGAHRRPFVLGRDARAELVEATVGNEATIEWQRSDDGGGSWRTVATSFQRDSPLRPVPIFTDWQYWRARHRFDVDAGATGNIRFRARACIEMQVADGPTATRTELRCDTSAAVTARVLQQATGPGFPTLPRSQLVLSGETASFSAVVDGLPAPALQWQTRPANSVGVWTDVPGATNPGLTTRVLTLADNGTQFRLIATNAGGSSASPPVTASVSDTAVAPVITAELSPIRALRGGDATFAVAVRGTEPLSYEWRLDGNVVSAQNGPQLNLQSVQGNRTVQVRVSNAAGTVTSRSVALEVFEREIPSAPPVIDRDPVATGGLEGATVSLAVQARGGSLTYRWQRNGADLPNAPDAPVLVLSSLTTAAEGEYRVIVSNARGSVTSAAAALTVRPAGGPLSAPTIDVQPTGLTLDPGETATFAVGVSGSGPLTFQWHRDGVPITGATRAVLTLSAISAADAANYTVRISNSEGSVTSAAAGLVVVPAPGAPRYVTQTFAQEAVVGDSLRIRMLAIGTPAPRCLWLRNGVLIPGATDCTGLDLSNVQLADSGAVFTSIAYSAGGAAVGGPAVLTVRVGVAPTVTQQPTNQVAAVVPPSTLHSARFSAAYSGVPDPQPNWRINGTLLGSATTGSFDDGTCQLAYDRFGAMLILSQIRSGCDGATVQGVATNQVGSVSTDLVRLSFSSNPPSPSVTTQPQSQAVTAGQSATFSAAVANAPYLQWERNSVPVSGATSSSYTIAATVLSDNGAVFRLLACTQPGPSGDCVYSDVVSLTVNAIANPAPRITAFSSNGPRAEAQSVTATVTATGNNLSYQWLLSFDLGASGIAIPGATAASYTTPPMGLGYANAALQVRVCSGAQPASIAQDPSCTFSSLADTLAQTAELGSAGICYGGPTGWCVRSPSPQPNELRALVLPNPSSSPDAPVVAVGFGTVMTSADFGVSWTTRLSAPRLDFRGLARLADGSRLVAAVAANTATQTAGGLYLSDDGGANWGLVTGVGSQDAVNDVALAADGSGVAVGSGLWRSAGNGQAWTPVTTGAHFLPEWLTRVVIRGGVTLAVTDQGGVLRSSDGGVNWTRVYSDTGARRLIDVALDDSGLAVAVIDNATEVLVSSNAGQSWSLRPLPIVGARGVGLRGNGEAAVLGFNGNVAASSDGGQTWAEQTSVRSGVAFIDRWRLAFIENGPGLAVGSLGALLRSSGLDDFYRIGGGNAAERITALEAAPNGTLLMARGGRLGRSTDGGATWSSFSQIGGSMSWLSDSSVFAVVSSFLGTAKLARSDDAGQTWTELWEQAGDTLTGVAMINSGVGVLIGTRGGQPAVFRTTNGSFWDTIGALPAGFEPRSVAAMNPGPLVDPNVAVVLVGSGDGRVLRTSNGGLSWQALNPGIGGAVNQIRRLDVSRAIAAADSGLWLTQDAGQTWSRVFDSSPYGSMTAVAANPGGGRCVATGMVGIVVGDCTNFAPVDLPLDGLLTAVSWASGSGDDVVAGGVGGVVLVNRNAGQPARALPDRRQRLGAARATAYPLPLVRNPALPSARAAMQPRATATLAPARSALPAARSNGTAALPPLAPMVVGPLRRHISAAHSAPPDVTGGPRR